MGDFKTPFSPLDRSVRQKMDREIRELINVMTQIDLTNIYRIFCPNSKEYTYFSTPHRTFSKNDHILGNKTNINRQKTIVNTPSILSDHHDLKLEVNSNTNSRKLTNI